MSLSLSTLQEQTIMARQTISYYTQPSNGFWTHGKTKKPCLNVI
jgi:hypothetical protein